ncbi:MAG: glycosyltransferase family 39 protein [Chloroflexi bacterium]|nr:glycosyltransferase family 39 protein [Chloroflexota bacterium]
MTSEAHPEAEPVQDAQQLAAWPVLLPRRALLAELALVLLLAGLALGVLRWQAHEQDFSVDESRWIATSRYFWITFLERDLFGQAWEPNYLVLTHPPVARYVIGFGLWLQGWTPDTLNGRYDTDRSRDFNRRQGNIPSRELLDDARRVVFVFALGASLLLYPIGRLLAGPAGGAAAVLFALANPLLPAIWTRTLAESVLAFLTLLAFWLATLVARHEGRARVAFWWAVGLGVSLGLGAATKLTGVLGGLGLALFALGQYALRWRATRRWPGLGFWPDAALVTVLTFFLVNPLLYPDPLSRTVMLFEHRRDEMQQQAIGTPRLAVPDDLTVRAALMHRRTFVDFGTLHRWLGLPLDAGLTVLGAGVALAASWRAARRTATLGPPALLLCWAASTYIISTVALGFDSSHYVALPLLWSVLFEGLAAAAGLTAGWSWLRQRRVRRVPPDRRSVGA